MGMEGFAGRIRRAFRAWEDRLGRDVTETELGELVGKAFDGRPISQQSINRWFAGTVPDHARLIALAKVLEVDPGWLAYGSGEEGDGDQNDGGSAATIPTPPKPHHPIQFMRASQATPIQRSPQAPKRRRKGGG